MSHSDVRLDFNFAMDSFVGKEGIRVEEVEALEGLTRGVHRGLHAMKEVGQIPFYQLPHAEESASKIKNIAEDYQGRFDTLVVLGIGGSALGTKAILSAIKGSYFNNFPPEKRSGAARVLVCDSIDPDSFSQLLETLDLQKTLFNVISKSGKTFETMTQMMVVARVLQERIGQNWKRHLVVTTDPTQGFLRKLVQENKWPSFEIPPGVGGRFSALSPVGLFPAAMGGVDIEELLAGARRGESRTQTEELWENPAYMLAALQYLMFLKKKNILVFMPYSDTLFPLAEWYCQLWAESIGKRFSLKGKEVFTGSTPVAACGTRDQHSQVQLYIEGPPDKFLVFLRVEKFAQALPMPADLFPHEDLKHLTRHSMEEVLQAEAKATEEALRGGDRPSSTLLIPRRSPYAIGQLLFLLQVATAFAGGLFDINPFDQPGVELGKKITAGILGKKSFELYQEQMLSQKKMEQFVI